MASKKLMRMDDVERIQQPYMPMNRPNKFAERKLKKGNTKIDKYIKR